MPMPETDPPPAYTEVDPQTQSQRQQSSRTAVELNAGQARVVNQVLEGSDVLITGSAGTGKSFVIKYLCKEFDRRGKIYRIAAPTGVAAVNVGGVTIHRFLGITPDIKSLTDYMKLCMKRTKVPWSTLDVIIIDEVSMIHPDLFNLFDSIARLHKRNNTPFGGIQMVLLGDYFQLSPIRQRTDKAGDPDYIFETELWKKMNLKVHVLQEVMRQNEKDFIDALNDLRVGTFSEKVADLILKCSTNVKEVGKHYVRLFPLNVDKKYANDSELAKLKTQQMEYVAEDKGNKALLKDCRAEEKIVLKLQCPVMLLWNMPEYGLCNGSIGILESFDALGYPVVKFNNGVTIPVAKQTWEIKEKNRFGVHTLASRIQIPLAVAYSLSVHKSQSLTLDHVEMDCKGIFTTGQLYVGLSRCATSTGLIIKNFDPDLIMVDDKVREFYKIHSTSR